MDPHPTSKTSPWLRKDRAAIDAFFEANGDRPLAECRDELLNLVNQVARSAYQEGGREMAEGMRG